MRSIRFGMAVGITVSLGLCAIDVHAGCSTDRHCKGDRICEAGTCVEPNASPAQPTPDPGSQTQASSTEGPTSEGKKEMSFLSVPEGITLHIHTGSGSAWGTAGSTTVSVVSNSYATVCTSPCNPDLQPGTYRLALSEGTGAPIESEGPVAIPGGAPQLTGEYKSFQSMRIAGYIVLPASCIGGAILALSPSEDGDYLGGKFYAGIGIMIVGSVVGLALTFKSDEAVFRISPASAVSLGGAGTSRADSVVPTGGSLDVTF